MVPNHPAIEREKKEPRLVETGVLKVYSAWLRGGDSNP